VHVVSIITVTYHNFSVTVFPSSLSCLLLVVLNVGLTVELNPSNQFFGVTLIELKLYLANQNALPGSLYSATSDPAWLGL